MDIDSAAAARRITTAAFDDTDAMLAASRRHDQQLLDDINAKLVRPTVTYSSLRDNSSINRSLFKKALNSEQF